MAHKKALGSAKKNKDSISKRLGVKVYGGQKVESGLDVNYNNILEAGEVDSSAIKYICKDASELKIYSGDLYINNADEKESALLYNVS